MRALEDNGFAEYLLRIGNGIEITVKEDLISIPKDMVIRSKDGTLSELHLINFVFPYLAEKASSSEYVTLESNSLNYE